MTNAPDGYGRPATGRSNAQKGVETRRLALRRLEAVALELVLGEDVGLDDPQERISKRGDKKKATPASVSSKTS